MEDLDAATVTNIGEFAKPNWQRARLALCGAAFWWRLLVNRGLVGDEIARLLSCFAG
jgi:hypothetical protein